MPTFIDIGAFKGEITKRAMDAGYEVYAFEPNPHMAKYLEPLAGPHSHIFRVAAWNEDRLFSELHLMRNPEPGEDGVSLIKEKENVSEDEVIRVPTINTGRFIRDEIKGDIDIIKINAEGAEYLIIESILDSGAHTKIKRWLVEDHENYIVDEKWRQHKQSVLKRLQDLGIKLEPWMSKF